MPSLSPSARERISLCMIVRNEAAQIGRCLESAREWVGEMVVVDTGSTDDTVAIAERHGARVIHFAWCDDFAAARNQALEAATREWALILDADELLEVVDPIELAKAVEQEVFDGISFRIHNQLDEGRTGVETVFRLFRRTLPGMRYRGALHEQVMAVSEGRVRTLALACIVLHHTGYTSAATASKGKVARNLQLSERLVEQQPDSSLAWFYLAQAQGNADRVEAMIASYEKALRMWEASGLAASGENHLPKLFHYLAQGQILRQQPERALACLDRGLALFPDAPDMRYARGHLWLAKEDFAAAERDFAVCLSPEAAAFAQCYDTATRGYAARTAYAVAISQQGRYEEAERALALAIAESPESYSDPRRVLGSMLLQRGAWSEALAPLQSAHAQEPAREDLRFQLGWCLIKLERFEEAEAVLLPLAERAEAAQLLGLVCLERGQGPRALAYLQACELPAAGLARGWAYYMTDHPTEAADTWNEWLRAGAADWGTKDTLATFLFLLQGGKRPSGQPERPAEPLRDLDSWFRLLIRYQRFEDVERVLGRGPELGKRMWWPLRVKWAVTLAKEGFTDLGLEFLLQAREDEPENPDVYYWLGFCALNKRMIEDARMMWNACLSYAPQHPLATRSLSLLT